MFAESYEEDIRMRLHKLQEWLIKRIFYCPIVLNILDHQNHVKL